MALQTLYLVVSGATTAYRAPELIRELAPLVPNLITLMTPGAARVISPREVVRVPGHRLVESYFDGGILPRPADGLVLVAPCGFNTLNKLAQGIADNLPLSLTAEAIGRGNPVVLAASMNAALWAHPRAGLSVETLRAWGVTVLDPVLMDGELTMTPTADIMAAVMERLQSQ